MSDHRYRVTQSLPWIDGGRPGPDLDWIDGTPVVYEPGNTIVVDDRELAGNVIPCLEAVDDDGRAALERARATFDVPAKRTMLTNLHPNARAWLIRMTDEKLRREGRILELVLRMLERGEHPTHADLHNAAVQADEPVPTALKDHVFEVFKRPQRPGPKHPRRNTLEDLAIKAYYQYELDYARRTHEADSRQPANVKDVAATITARAFKTSKRTVERIVASFASRPWRRDDPPA
jgi:hypothetical protein